MNDSDCLAELNFPLALNRFISASGIASRRKSAELIKNGQVTVNGIVVIAPGCRVTASDLIRVGGNVVSLGKRYYIVLNKPVGYICTDEDPYAPQKAVGLIDLPGVRLFSAGRLDKASEGLIIFSNDGDYVNHLMHPRYGVLKTYELTTDRAIDAVLLAKLLAGIDDAGERLKAVEFAEIAPCTYRVVLNEGKKREIRRMATAANCHTEKLVRVAVGNLKLGQLAPGCWRQLDVTERQLALGN